MPVLVIDEANHLKSLLRDPNGQGDLESLFEQFVAHTKEQHHFHVVLLNSDSFFNLWVEKFVGSSRYKLFMVGHLDKNEAQTCWNDVALKKNGGQTVHYTFEEVHKVCGGSIFLMDQFVQQYRRSGPNGLILKSCNCFSHV